MHRIGGKNYLVVRKRDLPIPLVVLGENGEVVVQTLVGAGRKKLGTRIGDAPPNGEQIVREFKFKKN